MKFSSTPLLSKFFPKMKKHKKILTEIKICVSKLLDRHNNTFWDKEEHINEEKDYKIYNHLQEKGSWILLLIFLNYKSMSYCSQNVGQFKYYWKFLSLPYSKIWIEKISKFIITFYQSLGYFYKFNILGSQKKDSSLDYLKPRLCNVSISPSLIIQRFRWDER